MFVCIQDIQFKYFILFSLLMKIDASIYIKPIEASYEDTKGVSDIRNYMFVTLPHDLLRSELPQSLESEPYNALNKDHYTNSTLELNKTQMEMLRKSWHATCDKKAAKTCRKACINTYKIVCSAYLCKKSMKRSFKRECKRNCRGRFVMSKGDSE